MTVSVSLIGFMVMVVTVLMAVMRMVVVAVWMVVVDVRVLVISRPGQNGLGDQRHPGSAVFA
jgi:hypothetical protein